MLPGAVKLRQGTSAIAIIPSPGSTGKDAARRMGLTRHRALATILIAALVTCHSPLISNLTVFS